MSEEIRVFIADASADYIFLLETALNAYPDIRVIGSAVRGDTAYADIPKARPDVLVMDLLLPGMDGLSLLRRLKKEGHAVCAIMLTASENKYIAGAALLLGARAFLPKPCAMGVLARRIRDAASRRCPPARNGTAETRKALLAFGIPQQLDGFDLLLESVCMAMNDRTVLLGITKILYPDLAKRFSTSDRCVERSIRGAIRAAWSEGNAAERRRYFGRTFEEFRKPPSNKQFISVIADFIESGGGKSGPWKP